MVCWNWWPVARRVSSSKCLVINCRPMGRPFDVKPQGTDIPGIPARFAEMVKMSDRYIFSGSSRFSPALNAGTGEMGPAITSHFLKASSNLVTYGIKENFRKFRLSWTELEKLDD